MSLHSCRLAAAVAGLVGLIGPTGAIGAADTSGATTTTPSLYSWGDFGSDDPISPIVNEPTSVGGVVGTIVQISTSNSDTYILTAKGKVWAVGAGQYGELGDGGTTNSFTTAVRVHFPAGIKIASLPDPMPYDTAFAIDANGNIWGWGLDNDGELCLGSEAEETLPVELPLSDVTLAAGAAGHASYVSGGTLYSCGDDSYGALGNAKTTAKFKKHPVQVVGLPSETIEAVTAGYGGTGVVLSDGSYWNWGLNTSGQLGDGSTTSADAPVEVPLAAAVSSVTQGGNDANDGQTLALLSNGEIVGWGSDGYGQLCNGLEQSAVTSPVTIDPPAGVTWVGLHAGGTSTYAMDASSNLWACGSNRDGEIGVGTTGGNYPTAVEVLSGVTGVSSTSHNVAART